MAVAIRSQEAARALDGSVVLRKALQRAGEELGLTAQEVAQAVGKSRTFFETARLRLDLLQKGLQPDQFLVAGVLPQPAL